MLAPAHPWRRILSGQQKPQAGPDPDAVLQIWETGEGGWFGLDLEPGQGPSNGPSQTLRGFSPMFGQVVRKRGPVFLLSVSGTILYYGNRLESPEQSNLFMSFRVENAATFKGVPNSSLVRSLWVGVMRVTPCLHEFKGFCITAWDYAHWEMTPFRPMSGIKSCYFGPFWATVQGCNPRVKYNTLRMRYSIWT